MSQLLLAVLCFICYLLIYYLVGVATSKILKFDNNLLHELVYGMFVYGILFFVYVLPLKFKLVPVSTIGVIWALFISILCLLIIIILRKYIKESLSRFFKGIRKWKLCFIPVAIFTIGFILFILIFARLPFGNNQVWFLGWPANGVLHNELMTYDTSSGVALERFPNDRYLSTFLDHSAVVCKLTGLHVMVEVRTVLSAIFTLMQVIIVWELARYFGKSDQKKSLFAFFMYWSIRNLLVGSQILPNYFSIFRNYEGKGMVMIVPLPLLFLLLWKMYDHPEDTSYMWKACITLWGAMTYSLSMMFSAPFVLVAFAPFVLARKDKRLIRNLALMLFVSGIFVVVYYLGRKGIIDLTIHR